MRTASKNNNNRYNVPMKKRARRGVPPRPDPARDWLRSIQGTMSPHTERALDTDIRLYRSWCRTARRRPWPVRAVDLAAFVDAMAAMKATATVERHVFSITALCRGMGWKDPRRTRVLANALRRMRRRNGSRQAQAHGLTRVLVDRLIAAAGDRLIDARNRALVAVAYDAMLRRSELADLRVRDLVPADDGSATLLVRRSKTDPEGGGAVLFLAPDTLDLVARWLERGGVGDGFLFRSVRQDGTLGERLDPSQVPRVYKSMARRAGFDADVVAGISGHSARVGAAQDMVASGIPMAAIMQAGRWKSTAMVSRYGERILPGRSGSAMLASIQDRHFLTDSGETGGEGGRRGDDAGNGKRGNNRTDGENRENGKKEKKETRESRKNRGGGGGSDSRTGAGSAATGPETIGSGKSAKPAFPGPKGAESREQPVPRFRDSGENMPPPADPGGFGDGGSRVVSAIDAGDGKNYSPVPDNGNYRGQE